MSNNRKNPLRSRQWFGGGEKSAFMHRSWMENRGMPEDMFDGRPVIGIGNTWSEMTPCNAHLRDGDTIDIDIGARILHLDVSKQELAQRQAEMVVELPPLRSGYQYLFRAHVQQVDLGCDFDFTHRSSELTKQRVSH